MGLEVNLQYGRYACAICGTNTANKTHLEEKTNRVSESVINLLEYELKKSQKYFICTKFQLVKNISYHFVHFDEIKKILNFIILLLL